MSRISYFCLKMIMIFLSSLCRAESFCSNQDTIAFLINRPTNATSPCAVAAKDVMVEGGMQHRWLTVGSTADIFPITEVRFGLPYQSEFYVFSPNYVVNHTAPYNGNTTFALGAKHEMWGNQTLVFSLDGFVAPPGGTSNYGTQAPGIHANAIVEYLISERSSFLFMLSYLHLGQPSSEPNRTYSAISPNAVLSFNLTPLMTVYAEFYGQSKTSPMEGPGYNIDGGLIFLVTKNITFDIEVARRIQGQLGQFENYVGTGGVIRL